jgi:hypothetical protein
MTAASSRPPQPLIGKTAGLLEPVPSHHSPSDQTLNRPSLLVDPTHTTTCEQALDDTNAIRKQQNERREARRLRGDATMRS